MENQIACPNCKKTITNNAVIDDAAKGVGSTTRYIRCDCGEKITYWQITAHLRNQKTIGVRFFNWVRSLSHSQS